MPVGQLSVARRQMVEIAKALSRDARLIVLDEPSAVLGDTELQGLFEVMRRLAANGTAFIYISHRLDEVFELTDRVTVMKDGRVVTTERNGDLTPERLVRAMVGRDVRPTSIGRRRPRRRGARGPRPHPPRRDRGRRVRRAGRRDPRDLADVEPAGGDRDDRAALVVDDADVGERRVAGVRDGVRSTSPSPAGRDRRGPRSGC